MKKYLLDWFKIWLFFIVFVEALIKVGNILGEYFQLFVLKHLFGQIANVLFTVCVLGIPILMILYVILYNTEKLIGWLHQQWTK